MIESFKQKLNSMSPPAPHNCHNLCSPRTLLGNVPRSILTSVLTIEESTTPPGSPPPNVLASFNNTRPNPAPSVIPASLAQTLANLSKIAQQSSSTPPAPAPLSAPVSAPYTVSGPPSNIAVPSFMNPAQPGLGLPYLQTSQAAAPPVAAPAPPFMQPQAQPPPLTNYGVLNGAANAMNGMLPGVAVAPAGGADQMVELIKQLVARGLPADQIAAIVKALNPGAVPAAAPQVPQPNQGAYPMPTNGNGNGWAPPRPDDRNMRSPTNRTRGRSRSRSPGRHWDSRESPRGRDDRRFGDFGHSSPPRDRFDDRERARPYRQRSPPGRRGSSPQRGEMPAFQEHKHVEFDPSLPQNHIKVMSRTLFVGGVTCPESELRNIFSRFGAVQTCIVNKEKRHAFVKMYTRKDAVAAKAGMEPGRTPDAQLRTRWGVGFGPRDCSDYQTGVSIIPIQKLTEADRKWMLTAPWGGSGGKPISHGMVVEEPDIEIGAGVSSKAISRRMQTDKGGSHGPKSSAHRDNDDRNDRGGRHGRRGGGRDHGHGRRDEDRPNSHNNPNNEPVVPAFGFGVQMDQNGMPVFPPGFQFPAPDAINNPPY